MSDTTTDYTTLLRELKQERERLRERLESVEAAIPAIEVLMPKQQPQNGDESVAGPLSKLFVGMTIGDAAKKYLAVREKPASTREITNALEAGGIEHESQNFYNTVYSVLRREQKRGEVDQVGSNWVLAPESNGAEKVDRSAEEGGGDEEGPSASGMT